MTFRDSSKLRLSFGNRRAVALVIILAFLVLLSGVVLAFFARAISERQVSNSSANQTKAEILAQGALDQILGDLKQEIADGSTEATIGATTIYLPASSTNMAPQLAGSSGTGGMKSVVKRSGYGVAFSANGTPRAANVSTLSASQNSRFISPARWNKPLLLPKSDQSATNDIDWTPEGATATGWASAPDWIYVSRNGSNPTSWNTNLISAGSNPTAVVGRFAYMVYNVSGLLDMNAAGYPSKATAVQIGGKAGLAYADLTQLTDSAGTQLLSNPQIDNLVGWRNFASASTDWTKTPPVLSSPALSGFPGAGTTGWSNAPASATNYFNYTLKNKEGYLKTENPLLNGGQSDRLFVSRQEMMRLLLGNIASQAATAAGKTDRAKVQNALQYLGTFSRAVTTPTWGPTYNASEFGGKPANAYKDKADDPSSANRNLLGVRHSTAGTVRDYADDGTYEEVAIEAGAPLVRTRFSLAKLAWLGHNGENSASFGAGAVPADAIKDCFGLTWNSSRQRWDYSHGDSNNILTLEEVRLQNRAPDFFELLKAGILSGSLGQQPGSGGGVDTATTGPAGLAFNYYSSEKDRHILQIGANIIDQADADNYPTAIYQPIVDGHYSVPYGSKELFDTVFGLENLPYLQRISAVSYAQNVGNGIATDPWKQGTEDIWLQPEVWNPHERTTADPTKYPDTPGHLRLVTYGGCQVAVSETDVVYGHPKTRERPFEWIKDFGTNPTAPNPEGIVAFVNPKPGNTRPADLFTSPVALQSAGVTTNGTTNYYDSISASGPKNYMFYAEPGAGTRLMGIWLGEFDRDPRDWEIGGYPTHTVKILPVNNSAENEPQMTFVLEYNDKPDGSGKWLPYTMMARVQEIRSTASYSYNHRDGYLSWFIEWGFGRPDPRTERFSVHSGRINSSGTTYNYQWGSGSSIRPSAIVKSKSGSPSGKGSVSYLMPSTSEGFYYQLPLTNSFSTAYLLDDWAWNLPATDARSHFWYADVDGVVRPGDAWRADYGTRPAGPADDRSAADVVCGDGVPLYEYTELLTSKDRRRPVILNRPFQSVGELGYVYRDLPFKTLDLSSEMSADAGLLDLFSVRHEPVVTSGRVNLSASPPAVLQAIVTGTLQNTAISPSVTISTTEAAAVAQAVADELSTGPLANASEIVHRLGAPIYSALTGISSNNTTTSKPISNKGYGEGPVRSLSSVVNTRTWNLMVDVIAQSGKFAPNAKSLDNFIVEGEKRYWLHVAIDRFTGKIIDQQLEPVYE